MTYRADHERYHGHGPSSNPYDVEQRDLRSIDEKAESDAYEAAESGLIWCHDCTRTVATTTVERDGETIALCAIHDRFRFCHECGATFALEDERGEPSDKAEVYLDVETLRANAGGQAVLVDDIPDDALGPYLVHADPCSRKQAGGRPVYTLA